MMMPMTTRMRTVLQRVEAVARQSGADQVQPEHLLTALAFEEGSGAARLLQKAGIDMRGFRGEAAAIEPAAEVGKLPFSAAAKQVVVRAGTEAAALGHAYVGTEHLALSLAANNGALAAALDGAGVSVEHLRALVRSGLA